MAQERRRVSDQMNDERTARRAADDSSGGLMTDIVSMFAGVLLMVTAAFAILQGASAIANDDIYAAGSDYLYQLNVTAWGWVYLVIGVLCFIAAIGILRGKSWGQISGIIVAGLSAIANFAFIPHYPAWAITIIALNVLIIHALSTQLKRG
jgi:hypothetical protein